MAVVEALIEAVIEAVTEVVELAVVEAVMAPLEGSSALERAVFLGTVVFLSSSSTGLIRL